MKKIRYIAFGVLALLFGVCLLSFIPKSDVSASGLNEGGEFCFDCIDGNVSLPDYGIADISGVSYIGYVSVKIRIDCADMDDNVRFLNFCTTEKISGSYTSANICFNDYSKLGIRSIKITCSDGAYFNFYASYGNLENYGLWLLDCGDSGYFEIEFLMSRINYKGFIKNSYLFSYIGSFSEMNDMDSGSVMSVMLLDFTEDTYLSLLFNDNSGLSNVWFDVNSDFYSFGVSNNGIDYIDYSSIFYSCFCVRDIRFISSYDKELLMDIEYIDIDVYRPYCCLKNSLIFYCYDYLSFLSYVNSFSCYYRRGDYAYKVFYEKKIPNLNLITFYCNDIENILFDEYISLEFVLSSSLTGNILSIGEDGVFISFGFDFNFVQYAQPLVASNGSYNYSFKKPSYVDMPFSLYPFYIPVLEMCQNAIIFVVFYCPIISDILELIYLDRFIGALLQIINFILGVPIGSFVLASIGFIVYYMVLRSFMPIIYDSVGDLYRGSNGYRYSQEKKKSKKEWQYQKYKDKKINKKVSKISNKKNQ